MLVMGFSRIFVVNCHTGETAKKKTQLYWAGGARPKTAAAVGGHDQKTQPHGGGWAGAQSKTANTGGLVGSEANIL